MCGYLYNIIIRLFAHNTNNLLIITFFILNNYKQYDF